MDKQCKSEIKDALRAYAKKQVSLAMSLGDIEDAVNRYRRRMQRFSMERKAIEAELRRQKEAAVP